MSTMDNSNLTVNRSESINNSDIMNENTDDFLNYIIHKMIKADSENEVFSVTFSNYSKGYYEDGKKLNHQIESFIRAKMTFKKPFNVLMDIIETPKDIARGSKLLYTGGDSIRVKAAGILGLIPVTFQVDNPIFSNARNHGVLEVIEGIKKIIDKDSNLELIGMSKVNNKDIYMLKVDAKQKLDDEITHEICGVDAEKFIVLLNEMYVGEDLVSQYKVENIETNISLPEDFFKL